MRIQQKAASYENIRKWKTGLIGQAKGSKVVYLSADLNTGPLKTDFHLYANITQRNEVIQII